MAFTQVVCSVSSLCLSKYLFFALKDLNVLKGEKNEIV